MAHFAELKSKVDPTGFTSNTHQVVERVVVVGNDIPANNGTIAANDRHVDGETWCANFFQGGSWKQTSYNNNFRKQYAGLGYVYDSTKDKFILPQPYASWSLDGNDDWQAPVTYPTIETYNHPTETYTQEDVDDDVYKEGHELAGQRINSFNVGDARIMNYNISWDEPGLKWTAQDHEDPSNNFNWDASGLTWVSA